MPAVNYTRTLGGQCIGLLEKLENFACSKAETKRTPLATLGTAESNGNRSAGFFRSGFNEAFVNETVQVQDGNGNLRHVIMSYLPRTVTANNEALAASTLDVCAGGATTDYSETLVDPDGLQIVWQQKRFNRRSWMKICEDPSEAQLRILMSMVDAINRTADTEIIKRVIEGAGGNQAHPVLTSPPTIADINTYRQIDIIDANKMPLWAGVNQLHEDFAVNEMEDCPVGILFGLKNPFATYKRAEKIGCCNDLGQDLNAVANELGFAPFQSRNVEAAFVAAGLAAADAPRGTVVIHPGSAHLIEVFDNLHSPFTDGQSFSMLWTDPVSGERFDLEIQFDRCSKDVVITLYKQFKVFSMPTDQFITGDHLFELNGTQLYNMNAL